MAYTLGELGSGRLRLDAILALRFNLGLERLGRFAQQLLFLFGDFNGDGKTLDFLSRFRLLLREGSEGLFLAFRLRALVVQFALDSGELLFGHCRVLCGSGDLLGQLGGRLLGGSERAGELRLIRLQLGNVLFALGQRGLRGRQSLRQLLASGALVRQGEFHRLDQVLVLGGGIGRHLWHRRLLCARGLRLLPTRERQKIQQEKIAEDKQQGLVHDAVASLTPVAAWLSRMSWRLYGRTLRIFTIATQVMPKRLEA